MKIHKAVITAAGPEQRSLPLQSLVDADGVEKPALGVMLYELATGDDAFPGETIPRVLSQIQAVDPTKLAAAVPEPFASVVSRALVGDARDRDITMQEIAEALG